MNVIRTGFALVGVAALVGCDIPTSVPDAPMVEQRWIVPVENTTISVDELLPQGVAPAGEFFGVTIDPFATERTLGSLCATCVNGVTAPAPSFNATFTVNQTFPSDVVSAVLAGGTVVIAVQNGFSFDPIAGGGSLVVTLTDGPGGKELGKGTISTAMTPGSTVTRQISLIEGPVGPDLVASVVLSSPGGQTATLNTSQTIVVSVQPTTILIASAMVNVANQAVELDAVDMDVSDIDSTISDRIQQGGIKLDFQNPFHVGLTASFDINYPGGTLRRTVTIDGAAVSSTSLSYSGDEFRTFLGKDGVTLTGAGSVTAAPSPILVRPGQTLLIQATLDLTLVIG